MYHQPMIRLVLRRLLLAVPLLLLVATLTFLVVHAAPGSYADAIDQPGMPPAAREMIRERFGLDLPFHLQYLRWLGGLARGDLGISFLYRQPVAAVILPRPAADPAPQRHRAAHRPRPRPRPGDGGDPPAARLGRPRDHRALPRGLRPADLLDRRPRVLVCRPARLAAALPHALGRTPTGWAPSVGSRDLLRHLVLPAACLGLVGAAALARYLRSTLLDVRSARFILAARARGLPERRMLWVHTLRPALLPVVTLLGLSLPFLVSGSVVVETVFSWPGMGQVLVDAAAARDLPVIMAVTVVGRGRGDRSATWSPTSSTRSSTRGPGRRE